MRFSTKTELRWVGRKPRPRLKRVLVHLIDGKEVSKRVYARELKAAMKRVKKHEMPKATAARIGCANWPLVSEALSVHPDQVQEAIDSARRKGVPTEFTKSGAPIFTSREHRKRYCEAYHFYDRQGGYGDAAPRDQIPVSYGDGV